MKKILLFSILALTTLIALPASAQGNPNGNQSLVPCNGPDCTITSFFVMLGRIYTFIIWDIATPAAIIALTIGGIMMLFGAANPNLFSRGKSILVLAIIGLILVFGSWVIINTVLMTIGYKGAWSSI